MTEFSSARLRLTFWYLIIIAFISLSFSGIIYRDFSLEIEKRVSAAETKLNAIPIPLPGVKAFLKQDLAESKKIFLWRLVVINLVILIVSGIGGYFLAGVTLTPVEKTIKSQKRFIADASHELKTPLTSLITATEVALRSKNLNLHEAKQTLSSNLEEAEKIKDFVHDLLSLSKYEALPGDFPKETVELSDIIKDGLKINTAQAKKKKVKIIKIIKKANLNADRQSLTELVSILVDNAIKYSKNGGKIVVNAGSFGKKAVIEVSDEGLGIDKEELAYIFERFYRVEKSRNKQMSEGYGLGLSIAKSIVEKHGGVIGVKSTLGAGSKFKVVLPGTKKTS